MNAQDAPEISLAALENGSIDAGTFDHAAHVHAAWLYLAQYSLPDAIAAFSAALRRLTVKLGVPDKYHETVTWFFMLLIAERRAAGAGGDWPEFCRDNPDLLCRRDNILKRYYSSELLASDRARHAFVLPDRLVA